MLIKRILRRMLSMSDDAWYIFIRSIQLVGLLMLCSFALLLHCDGHIGGHYSQYMTALSLMEVSQALLLIAVIASVCIEDAHTGAKK